MSFLGLVQAGKKNWPNELPSNKCNGLLTSVPSSAASASGAGAAVVVEEDLAKIRDVAFAADVVGNSMDRRIREIPGIKRKMVLDLPLYICITYVIHSHFCAINIV